MMGKFGCKIAILEILIITGLKSDAKLSDEDKTWTRGPWTTPILDRVPGPLIWARSIDPL